MNLLVDWQEANVEKNCLGNIKKGKEMDDLIHRKAAIDALSKAMPSLTTPDGCGELDHDIYIVQETMVDDMRIINDLPSAQPEIIHCGDCKYKDDGIDEDGIPFLKCLNGRSYGGTRINDFCSWAERRTDADAKI